MLGLGGTSAPRGRRVASSRTSKRRASTAPLADVRAFIDRHYASDLQVQQLAAMAGLSKYHFIRAFDAAFGSTPHQYARARRIDRAKELLVTTPLPVTDICDAVGFRSLGSFSDLFRQVTGETPTGYRGKRRRAAYIPACFIRMYRAG